MKQKKEEGGALAPWPLMRLEHLFNNKMLSSTPRPFNVLRLPPSPRPQLEVQAEFMFSGYSEILFHPNFSPSPNANTYP